VGGNKMENKTEKKRENKRKQKLDDMFWGKSFFFGENGNKKKKQQEEEKRTKKKNNKPRSACLNLLRQISITGPWVSLPNIFFGRHRPWLS